MTQPKEIDGATVIMSIKLTDQHQPTGFTTHYAEGFKSLDRLAICKYEKDPGFYLFYCEIKWNVLNDTYHESMESAIEQAELEFKGTKQSWNTVNSSNKKNEGAK
ncbi:MAG: hypothetical protein RIB71_17630 [Imperialibacter sp.]|uniref:hypothetical protein n=1 Tax=Imperialibacter sp. TaxID=2038411 RepID=UPI0032ED4718